MLPTRLFSLAALAALCSCVNQPDYYAPPKQREAFAGPDTRHLQHFIKMNDPYAEAHFLRDVGPLENESWRWTGQRPTLRFVVPKIPKLRFVMDFGLSSETMKQTGPVTITYYVNGRVLDQVTYESEGQKRFEKIVPPDWLKDGEDVVASAELDKVWVSPEDGNKLGVTLVGAGFLD
jgi:hypothetical protein